jgi:uncharacterized repeat protein (TIGR01451 family)
MFSLDGYLVTDLLGPGKSEERTFYHVVSESELCDDIENTVVANGTDPLEKEVSDNDDWCVPIGDFNVTLEIGKTASFKNATVGDVINYTITVRNAGEVNITDINVTDDPTSASSNVHNFWTVSSLAPGENQTWNTNYTVVQDDIGSKINNTARAEGLGPCGPVDPVIATKILDTYSGFILELKKTANKKEVEAGEEIEYTIEVCNLGASPVHNVKVRDVFMKHHGLIPIISIPEPENGSETYFIPEATWTFAEIGAGKCVVIKLVVKVPERQDFEFDMAQGVNGEGFVNIANDYSTTFQLYVIRNCAYASSDETLTVSDCEEVKVVAEIGTELSPANTVAAPTIARSW